MVAGVDAVNALEVTHHKALEVPAVLQYAGEEFLVAGGGDAVYGVVAGHDAEGAVLDGRPEGGQHVFFQVPEADMRGTAVVTALGDAIGHKVLEGGDDALRRGSAHHGRCHLRGEVNVFSIGFFHAGPAGFAGEVYHRAIANGASLGHKFGANHLTHLFDELGVPGGAEADGGGEYRGAYGHVPVGGFFGQDDGNAQAGGIYGVVLQGVIGLHGQPGVEAGFQSFAGPGICPERGPEHAAVLFLDEIPEGVGDTHLPRCAVFFIHRPSQRAQQLAQFFVYGHAGEEVIGPFLGAP